MIYGFPWFVNNSMNEADKSFLCDKVCDISHVGVGNGVTGV